MSKDYAEQRAAILRDLDGLPYNVHAKKKAGFLWLDRPPLNVVSYRGRSQIAAIIESFGTDADVRVVVIRGKNGVYTSGGDVKAFPQIERDGMSHLAWNIAAAERCPKPVVCVLERYAMGVGLELAMACDIRIATKDTVLALPEVTLGQIPGSGGSQRVARIAGLAGASPRPKPIAGACSRALPTTLRRSIAFLTTSSARSPPCRRLRSRRSSGC